MAEKLTLQQQSAVTDRGGDLLVSAAAGSGKTKVLVERLMQRLTDAADPANIDDFLIITYTKAAASELRGKISKALTQRIAEDPTNRNLQRQFQRLYLAKISTVHAFCADILREYAYMLEISGDFRMIEEQEDKPLRYEVIDRLLADSYDGIGDDADFAAFVDTQGVGRNDQLLPDLILKVYDSAKCHMDPNGWLERCLSDADTGHLSDASETVWGKYLIENLHHAIDLHLISLEKCADSCDQSDGLDKMAAILRSIHSQLRTLRQCTTWDAVYSCKDIDFGSLKGMGNRKNMDQDTYEAAKKVRDFCSKDITGLLKDFANDSNCVLADLGAVLPAVRGLIGLVRQFDLRYQRVKKALRVMDFSDLEHNALDLLLGKSRQGPTAVARQIGSRFRQIMVDEYQDSNQVQDAIFSALTQGKNNLFMVGDVKQSIYQFRLADPGIFLEKYNRFDSAENAEPGQGRKIVLSNNFRSGPEVIEAVNSVFRTCMTPRVGGLEYGDDEALWEGVAHRKLNDTAVALHLIDVESDTYAEEAEYVAGQIQEMLDSGTLIRDGDDFRPVRPDDIAILLRSPKTSGWDFHNALQKRGYQTASSHSIDLLCTDEVEWLRSFLQTINNPRQDIPLIATLCGPVFGFGANDLAKLRAENRKASFYDALCNSQMPKAISFLDTLRQLRNFARVHSLTRLLQDIFMLTDADSVYAAMEDGDVRSANLQEFYQFVVRFSATPGTSLQQLLKHLQQCEEDGLTVNRQSGAVGCIQITSIHKSKGLEYPVVFLCGLSRIFNMRSANSTLLCDPVLGIGPSCTENASRIRYPSIANSAISRKIKCDSISEELRVLYVAMTRPRDRLIMTFAQSNLADKLFDQSVKLDFCPAQLITSRATCLGSWVLYAAMQRTEAGSLFAVSRKPDRSKVSDIPWDIRFFSSHLAEEDSALIAAEESVGLSPETVERIAQHLAYTYPAKAATSVPSKQTATQRKGRTKDQEAGEDAPETNPVFHWRNARTTNQSTGKTRGSAVHAVMQHLDLSLCANASTIADQIDHLTAVGRISREQSALVDPQMLARFFASDIGKKVQASSRVVREFKFSILEDASRFYPGVSDEKILLQGVVDCAIIEEDGITVIDFKTDRFEESKLSAITEHYRPQVEIYADALSRIFQKPVKQSVLYFFSIDKSVTF